MNPLFWALLAFLLIVAGALYVRRLRGVKSQPGLTDEMIALIEERGAVEIEEPLDLDEAAAEEELFWDDEPWDEPEPY